MNDNTTVLDSLQGEARSLAARLANLSDPRDPRGVRYALLPLLILFVLAKLSNNDTPEAISDWVAGRTAELKQGLGLAWKRMPSHSTWRRLLQWGLELPALEREAGAFLVTLAAPEADTFNLDGKCLRGTIPSGQTHGLHLLALQERASNAVAAQTQVAPTENEISAAPRLLRSVALDGKVVTGDAIFTQRGLSRQIVRAGGDYLWLVKDNQSALRAQLESWFGTAQAEFETARTLDKGHGRIEERVLKSSSQLNGQVDWPYLGQVFQLRREVYEIQSATTRSETVYGITSLPGLAADATRLLSLSRGHWSIENGLHYRRDVTFHEDATRLKSTRAAQALAVFNNLALGLLRHAGWNNIAKARRYFAAHRAEALQLILCAPSRL
jgi:predicted transposase YbfD/YdcC